MSGQPREKFKILAQTADLTDTVIDMSLSSAFSDFKDGIQYFSALKADCTAIITRNAKDFKKSEIPVLSPDEFLASRKET